MIGRCTRNASVPALLVALVLALGCAGEDRSVQRSFESPEVATQALLDAIALDDVDALLWALGPEHRAALVTDDWEAEREAREEIVTAADEKTVYEELDDGSVEIVVGEQGWPLPIVLVQDDAGAWRFDTEEGIEEIVNRRVGRNELSAIALAHAYVDAQIEYARADRDGDGVLEYAQRLASTPGQRDGLFWKAGEGEEESPFGPLVEGAESYLVTKERGDPLRGYFFKVLTKQGENPRGGAHDYVINGNMVAGFALVAYPADPGNSGVMAFVVSHRGKVQQKNLGPFDGMDAYDPDETWTEVDD